MAMRAIVNGCEGAFDFRHFAKQKEITGGPSNFQI
jgi:hypothetical protein